MNGHTPFSARTTRVVPRELVANGNPLVDYFLASNDGSIHKWHHYFDTYHRAFSAWIGRPVRMLEVGVDKGGSLRMWRDYFGSQSEIVGVDIDASCLHYDDPGNRIHVRVADQSDAESMAAVAEEFGPFDIVLDDGGHTANQQLVTFETLYLDHVRSPGVYMVEDTHTSYWPDFRDRGPEESFMATIPALIDQLHELWIDHRRVDFVKERELRVAELEVPAFAAATASINVHDSIVWFERVDQSLPTVEQR